MVTLSSDSRPIISRGSSPFARALILVIISVGVMVLDHRLNYLESARQWMSATLRPLQALVDLPGRTLSGMSSYFADRTRLKSENAAMREQLRLANLRLLRFESLAAENVQLRAIRESSAEIKDRTEITEIMRVDIDPYRHRVLLNKGLNYELYKGQPVLDASGVFGQVTRVNRYSAEVILITDAETATPVRINRSGLRTIASGTGSYDKLSLPFITGDADIRVGDLLVTSGLGGVFPPGYPVAHITKVQRESSETFATVEAKPLAQMDHARELLLVWHDVPAMKDAEVDAVTSTKSATSAKSSSNSSLSSGTSSSKGTN
jgi:rod shape-determining protein MreC